MMKHKQKGKVFLGLILLIAVVLLAACGGEPQEPAAPPESPPEDAPAAAVIAYTIVDVEQSGNAADFKVRVEDRRASKDQLLSVTSEIMQDGQYADIDTFDFMFYGMPDDMTAPTVGKMFFRDRADQPEQVLMIASWEGAPDEADFATFGTIMTALYADMDKSEDDIKAGLVDELGMSVEEMDDLINRVMPYTLPREVAE